MRQIKYIVIHCTAGYQSQTVADVKKWWIVGMKWKQVGYHILITADGTAHRLAEDSAITNGVAGYNSNSLHVSYTGGIDSKGRALDNRTDEQKNGLESVVRAWKKLYPSAEIVGHRDLSKDLNGDGKITQNEWAKSCPAFEVSTWIKQLGL